MPGFKEDRDAFDGGVKTEKLKTVSSSGNGVLSLDFAKVFFYMFIGLAITAAVAFGLGYIIYSQYVKDTAGGGTSDIPNIYLGLIIGASVFMFVLMLIINFVVIRGKHSVLVPGILYTVAVGVLFSTLTIFVDWRILGLAFGITSGVFLLMSLIAMVSKGSMSGIGMAGLGLLLGGMILALVNWLIGSTTIYWIVSFVIFAALMFITMYDIYNVKRICENGQMNSNMALYCAFIMYVDFINIFVRIVYYLIIVFGNKK